MNFHAQWSLCIHYKLLQVFQAVTFVPSSSKSTSYIVYCEKIQFINLWKKYSIWLKGTKHLRAKIVVNSQIVGQVNPFSYLGFIISYF
jgi:hypothetical protein